VRLGTAAVTTRGFGRDQIATIADVIVGLVRGGDAERFRATIQGLCEAFPLPR
jgi:glycine hydroxymethyltransferase